MSLKRRFSLDNLHTADSDSWIEVDTKKAKRSKNKSKTKLSVSQPAELITDVINAVAEGTDVHTNTRCSSTQTESSDFCGSAVSLLQLMQSELQQLRETVNTMSCKIDQLTTVLQAESSTKAKLVDSSYASVIASAPPASTVHVTTDQHRRPAHSFRPNHQQDPVTAMYMDLSLKKRRANNIVITGMPPAQSPDHETKAVVDLLASEYDWDCELWPGVSVVRCRRLGKPQEGKLQPLLVTLDTEIQAEFYIKNAKQLRNSSQPEVRNNIFINPDLTPAEGKAAYELRQKKKQRRQESEPSSSQRSHITRTIYPSTRVEPRLKWRVPATDSENVLPADVTVRPSQSVDSNLIDEIQPPTTSNEGNNATDVSTASPSGRQR